MEAEGSVLMTSAATPDSIKDDVQPRPPATSLLKLQQMYQSFLQRYGGLKIRCIYFFLSVFLFTLIRLFKIRVSRVLSS